MKYTTLLKAVSILALLFTITACEEEKEGNTTVIEKPGGTITVIEDAGEPAGRPSIKVERIDPYENMQISDWLDEDTVIVAKDNEALEKMSLAELSDAYPRSLYVYHLDTKEYELLKERENAFLGEAALSADKGYLLYSEVSLGDPVYYMMNLDTGEEVGLYGESIGGAMSARWADNDTIIGAAYSGGAYMATKAGEITTIDELQEEALFIVHKMKDKWYYNTSADETLQVLDLATKEKASLGLEHVYDVVPSPSGDQLLVLQQVGDRSTLVWCDETGGNRKTIAEGAELGGVSWSQDQRMIAYSLKADVSGTTHGLYVYDMLSDESTQIAVGIGNTVTRWSPSGESLAYTEWSGTQFNSHIVHIDSSL
ncbi:MULTISPECIES: hypothetical protein [Paenibacillus]|uniref:WD40 repeat domain-containing protein n=1 Tax=Paenibacillus campinasensis TaxID=66347 RepID=A0A268ELX6_9BACL|nr:hypothetical protein [Paenibacillus campinasensis]PAD74125.1 hypothetical protein CHH67_18670 [Paenibacillus campinasensis]